jgi:hypothetical protein
MAYTDVMSDRHNDDSERDQAGAEPQVDRRKKHEARQAAAGFTRCIVRCHKDDVAKIKAYAATLLRQRQGGPH